VHIARIIIVVLLAIGPISAPAFGQSCNFSITDLNFGPIDVINGGNVDVSATLNINCGLGVAVRICPSIGTGSGGATATHRRMIGPGGSFLLYQLYVDPPPNSIWGAYSGTPPGTPPTIDLLLGGSTTRTIYGRVHAGQSTVPVGSYMSVFSSVDIEIRYGNLGILACPNLLLPQIARPTFTVSAEVESTCLVTAQDINFGSHGVIISNIDAMGEISVTCTKGAPYTISLDGGTTGGTPTARKMSKGAEQITYGLYRNAGRTLGWGQTNNVDNVAGMGTGIQENYTVYARVPPQPTPSPGVYTDTIVVTIMH
jgi:spore coat protein U-like protein